MLDGATAEGAQGCSQSPGAQLVGALPAEAVLAAADADLQRGVHADKAHLHMHMPLSFALEPASTQITPNSNAMRMQDSMRCPLHFNAQIPCFTARA